MPPGVALAGQKPCAEPLLADAEIYIVSHSTDADAQVIIAGGDEEGITRALPHRSARDRRHRRRLRRRTKHWPGGLSVRQHRAVAEGAEARLPRRPLQVLGDDDRRLHAIHRVVALLSALPAPVILFPGEGSRGVPTAGFTATWQAIAGAEAVRVQVEVEETAAAIAVDLPGHATSFHVPGDFLQPRVLYTMDVIGIAENGNRTVADVQFTTGR